MSDQFKRFLVEFKPAEMLVLSEFKGVSVNDIFDEFGYLSFRDMNERVSYIIDDKPVIAKMFSLLDESGCGLVSTHKLKKFVEAVQDFDLHDKVMTDVSFYTDYQKVIRDERDGHSSEGKLTVDGAKQIIASLRGGPAIAIRDNDLAIEYLTDLTEQQLKNFFENCPEAAWISLSR